jgi:hypothetical protein
MKLIQILSNMEDKKPTGGTINPPPMPKPDMPKPDITGDPYP